MSDTTSEKASELRKLLDRRKESSGEVLDQYSIFWGFKAKMDKMLSVCGGCGAEMAR